MPESDSSYLRRASITIRQVTEPLLRTRRRRWITGSVAVFLLLFTIAGFFLVPHILRGILTGQVATSLHRPVSVGTIRFDPYTLRLQIDRMQVGDRSEPNPLVGFEHLDVQVSWMSLFRFAPIVHEITLVKPAVNVIRQADGNFNFSDLLAPNPAAPKSTPTPSTGPPKFAVSNIRIIDGNIAFDDRKTGEQHAIQDLDLNVPFIANLPSKLDVVVEPLLQMKIDGRSIRIAGASKPFAGSLDSALTLDFHRIDLPRYTGYLPPSLAIKLPSGALSIDALLHFRQSDTGPVVEINGAVALDQFDLRDSSNAPVLALDHGEVKMIDVEPLDQVISLSEIELAGLKVNAVRNKDGTLNFSTLTGPPAPATAARAISSAAPTAAPSAAPTSGASQLHFGVDTIRVMDSSVNVTDLTGATPASEALEGITANVNNLHLQGQLPAQFDLNGSIHSGGTVAIKGTVDIPKSEAGADVTVDQVDLPGLQGFAQSAFAGTISSGKFTLHATLKSQFASDKFDVHVEPADLAIDTLAIQQPRVKEPPIAWNHFSVALGSFDLASRQADVKEVHLDALKAYVRRSKRGALSLEKLIKTSAPPPKPRGKRAAKTAAARESTRAPAATEPAWNYQVESVAIEKTDLRFEDTSTPRIVRAQFSPLNIHVKNLSSDFAKPIDLQVDGVRNGRGTFKIDGTAAIKPVKANLKIETRNLDMAAANEYVSTKLNAQVTKAELTMKADVGVEQVQSDYRIKYGGDLTLGDLTAIDKLTGDDFVDWKALSVRGGEVVIGEGVPKVRVREISLADFDARVILNSSGKLNLSDLVIKENAAPTSLTRTEEQQPAPAPTAAPTPAAAAPAAQPISADILVDKVTLKGGHIDYSDDFIKPHYSANLTDISGSVGTFGTSTQQPAEVDLQGAINGSAPLNISGSINPLAPLASVDIKADAKGIELTGLSAYSTKYTGYPIIKGSLNVDVHYTLNQGELTANNHLFIDQLTFGDRVENSSAANLPVRFAVAVLKNSRGEIDLTIPVSGSLSDPQFSIGSVIWHAFANVLTKAVTAPFTLLASAIGAIAGGGGGAVAGGPGAVTGEDLSYVAFDPGYATLSAKEKNDLTLLSTALADHPALKLTICGRVDPDRDMQGLREAWVTEQIRDQKIKDIGAADPDSVEVTQADYDKYLPKAYSHAKIPKPRDFIGLARDIPPDQMKKLMIEHAPVTRDDLPKLANARANVVRMYLRATVPPARLSILPPKLNTEGITEGATTRADLGLGT